MPNESEKEIKIEIEDDAIKKINEIAEAINSKVLAEAEYLVLERMKSSGGSIVYIRPEDLIVAFDNIRSNVRKEPIFVISMDNMNMPKTRLEEIRKEIKDIKIPKIK